MPKEGILLLVRLEKEWSIRRCARWFEKSLNRDSKGKIYFHLSVENVALYQGNEDVLQDPKALQFLLDRLDLALNRKFTVQIFVSMFKCECLFFLPGNPDSGPLPLPGVPADKSLPPETPESVLEPLPCSPGILPPPAIKSLPFCVVPGPPGPTPGPAMPLLPSGIPTSSRPGIPLLPSKV